MRKDDLRKFELDCSAKTAAELAAFCITTAKDAKEPEQKHLAYALLGMTFVRCGKIIKDKSLHRVITSNVELLQWVLSTVVIVETQLYLFAELGLELTAIEDGLLEVEFTDEVDTTC